MYRGDLNYQGLRHGLGKYEYQEGGNTLYQYNGSWKHGKKHSQQGKFLIQNVSEYQGEFQNGEMTGFGTRTWADGRRYTGEWLNGEMHGKGTWTKDNEVYEGDFVNNARQGLGTLTIGKKKYQGGFLSHRPHGKNKFIIENCLSLETNFNMGTVDGRASIHWHKSASFFGAFTQGIPDGESIFSTLDGSYLFEGPFRWGVPEERLVGQRLWASVDRSTVLALLAAEAERVASLLSGGKDSTTQKKGGKEKEKKEEKKNTKTKETKKGTKEESFLPSATLNVGEELGTIKVRCSPPTTTPTLTPTPPPYLSDPGPLSLPQEIRRLVYLRLRLVLLSSTSDQLPALLNLPLGSEQSLTPLPLLPEDILGPPMPLWVRIKSKNERVTLPTRFPPSAIVFQKGSFAPNLSQLSSSPHYCESKVTFMPSPSPSLQSPANTRPPTRSGKEKEKEKEKDSKSKEKDNNKEKDKEKDKDNNESLSSDIPLTLDISLPSTNLPVNTLISPSSIPSNIDLPYHPLYPLTGVYSYLLSENAQIKIQSQIMNLSSSSSSSSSSSVHFVVDFKLDPESLQSNINLLIEKKLSQLLLLATTTTQSSHKPDTSSSSSSLVDPPHSEKPTSASNNPKSSKSGKMSSSSTSSSSSSSSFSSRPSSTSNSSTVPPLNDSSSSSPLLMEKDDFPHIHFTNFLLSPSPSSSSSSSDIRGQISIPIINLTRSNFSVESLSSSSSSTRRTTSIRSIEEESCLGLFYIIPFFIETVSHLTELSPSDVDAPLLILNKSDSSSSSSRVQMVWEEAYWELRASNIDQTTRSLLIEKKPSNDSSSGQKKKGKEKSLSGSVSTGSILGPQHMEWSVVAQWCSHSPAGVAGKDLVSSWRSVCLSLCKSSQATGKELGLGLGLGHLSGVDLTVDGLARTLKQQQQPAVQISSLPTSSSSSTSYLPKKTRFQVQVQTQSDEGSPEGCTSDEQSILSELSDLKEENPTQQEGLLTTRSPSPDPLLTSSPLNCNSEYADPFLMLFIRAEEIYDWFIYGKIFIKGKGEREEKEEREGEIEEGFINRKISLTCTVGGRGFEGRIATIGLITNESSSPLDLVTCTDCFSQFQRDKEREETRQTQRRRQEEEATQQRAHLRRLRGKGKGPLGSDLEDGGEEEGAVEAEAKSIQSPPPGYWEAVDVPLVLVCGSGEIEGLMVPSSTLQAVPLEPSLAESLDSSSVINKDRDSLACVLEIKDHFSLPHNSIIRPSTSLPSLPSSSSSSFTSSSSSPSCQCLWSEENKTVLYSERMKEWEGLVKQREETEREMTTPTNPSPAPPVKGQQQNKKSEPVPETLSKEKKELPPLPPPPSLSDLIISPPDIAHMHKIVRGIETNQILRFLLTKPSN